MTFEQQNIGGRPFAKPELRELPSATMLLVADQVKSALKERDDLSVEQIFKQEVPDVRKTSKAPKKAAAKVHSKPNKSAVARVQKKV